MEDDTGQLKAEAFLTLSDDYYCVNSSKQLRKEWMNEWMNEWICAFTQRQLDRVAAGEMTSESLYECLDGHSWSPQFDEAIYSKI